MKTRADWERLQGRLDVGFGGASRIHTVSYFDPFVTWPDWHTAAAQAAAQRERGRFVLLTVYGPFEATWRKHGFEATLMDLATDPGFAADMARVHTDLILDTLMLGAEYGIVPDGLFLIEDMGMTSGLLFSPRAYEHVLFPQHRRLGDYLREHGIAFFMHSDGDIRKLIPRIIDSGVEVLQPLEAHAGLDVRVLKSQYGQNLSFMGNIDVRALSGTPAEMEEEIRSKVPIARAGGGYIYHSDHSVPPTVTFEAYRHLMELLQIYGCY